jgi:uncharacterized protein (DUF2252 family)
MVTRSESGRALTVDPVDPIVQVNRGRVPQLLQRKFDAMAADRFAFLRATAMLGHRAIDLAALPVVPLGWVCGDLHLQNFGSYRGSNRLVYFDLNDFDEAARLPVCVDLLRFLGSLFTAAPGIGVEPAAVAPAARLALQAYASALARGKAFWLERETAFGPIAALLKQTGERRRRDLLASRTLREGARRKMIFDGKRYLAVAPRAAIRTRIAAALDDLTRMFDDGHFFQQRDVAFRIAGMGSLGVPRYVALVRGKGDPDRNALIDFKHAVPSSAAAAFPLIPQPKWPSEAARVIGIQDYCQAAPPAFLSTATMGGISYVVRELQPVEDRVALPPLARRLGRLDETLQAMARLAAYAQLRSAGRQGAAGVDELIAFGTELLSRPAPWIETARAIDAANSAAFARFAAAWKAGDERLLALTREPTPTKAPSRKKPTRATKGKATRGSAPAKGAGKRVRASAPAKAAGKPTRGGARSPRHRGRSPGP